MTENATCDLCPWTRRAETWVDARVAAAEHYDQAHRTDVLTADLDLGALTVSHI